MASKQTNRSAIRRTNPRTRPYYHRRCKRGNFTTIDSLPDELLLEILSRVSAQDIHQKARFVCKRWNRLVHGDAFSYKHLRRTSHGLLLQLFGRGRWGRPVFVTAAQGGEIELSELSFKLRSSMGPGCNGLILETDGGTRRIVNPVTKGYFDLPELPDFARIPDFGMAYAAASMEYKVVATYFCSSQNDFRECSILTVGAGNTWRHVATQQLSPEAKDLLDCYCDLVTTEGFMHWASPSGNDVLTMNVETEVFTESHAPLCPLPDYKFQGSEYRYLSTGRYLSLLISCGDFLWKVWEMKGGSGEWKKVLAEVNLNSHKSEIQQLALDKDYVDLVPGGWVIYPEVLLLFFEDPTATSCIIYDLNKDEIESVKLPAAICSSMAMVHKSSLVCIR